MEWEWDGSGMRMEWEWMGMEWKPSRDIDDPVVWHKRSFNKIADYIVNHTMDAKRSWYQKFTPPLEDFDLSSSNLVMHIDGGTRIGHCSASAWYLEVQLEHDRRAIQFPLAMAAPYPPRHCQRYGL